MKAVIAVEPTTVVQVSVEPSIIVKIEVEQ